MNRPIRILHTESSCGWGGQEIRILTEMAGMVERGYELHLLCPVEAKIYSAAKNNSLPVTAVPIARKNIAGLLAMRSWLKNNPVDVVVTHSSTDSWLTAVACQTIAAPPKIIRLRHVSAPVGNNFSTRWLYNTAAKHIVTTGKCISSELANTNRFAAERITTISTGIDLTKFIPGDKTVAREKLGLDESEQLIGSIATLRSWKGHHHLIEAFSQLDEAKKNLRLVIVGDGPRREYLHDMVVELGLEERVLFTGNQEDTVTWFQALDIFVLASYANEGIPQALMQAMACGLPVIGGDVGGIPETIDDRKTGFLFPPQNVPALVSALQRFIKEPQLAVDMGRAAHRAAQENFAIDIMLDKMESVIKSVLQG
ncbi:MAG: glycosyltransferase family 4 protein [Magnetococcales bacterium]|nr:glycosyltransferase family 4 protein [Magnetococcales bacterium]